MEKAVKSSALLVLLAVLASTTLFPFSAGWLAETRLTTNSQYDGISSIAQMQNNDVWLVWERGPSSNLDIYYKIFFFENGTWSRDKRLFQSSVPDISPFITQTRNGSVFVFWAMKKTAYYDIVYKRTNDYGLNWSSTFDVTNSSNFPSDAYDDKAPSVLEVANGDIWVVWQRTMSAGNEEIFYKINHAGVWSSAVQLTSSPTFDKNPFIVQATNGSIMVFWSKYQGDTDYDIVYRVYKGSDSDWGPEINLTLTPTWLSSDPAVILTRTGALWAIWSAQDVNTPGVKDTLYYAFSEDNGDTWSPASLVTYNASYNAQPTLTQGHDKRVWVAWTSDRDNNFELYYTTSDPLLYHDVAVKNLSLSQTSVYQGVNVSVTVGVENQGDFQETLTVKCYANQTLVGSQTIIMPEGNSSLVVIPWNTSTFAPGNYLLKATVDIVPNENVINQDDNNLLSGQMFLRIPGDVNSDGKVDLTDLSRMNSALGSNLGQPNWNQECDINRNNVIDVADLYLLSSHFGQTI